MADSFIDKLTMIYNLGKSRDWHPNHITRKFCGQYYMTGNKEVDGKEITINIEAICNHKGIPLKPFVLRCDQLFEVLEKSLQLNFKDTKIILCDSNFKTLWTYKIV